MAIPWWLLCLRNGTKTQLQVLYRQTDILTSLERAATIWFQWIHNRGREQQLQCRLSVLWQHSVEASVWAQESIWRADVCLAKGYALDKVLVLPQSVSATSISPIRHKFHSRTHTCCHSHAHIYTCTHADTHPLTPTLYSLGVLKNKEQLELLIDGTHRTRHFKMCNWCSPHKTEEGRALVRKGSRVYPSCSDHIR